MKLVAIHAIYRSEKKKQIRVSPGEVFECPEAEGEEYLAKKAASVPPEDKKPAAKPTVKPAAKKSAPTPKKAADKKAGQSGDGNDELLG